MKRENKIKSIINNLDILGTWPAIVGIGNREEEQWREEE